MGSLAALVMSVPIPRVSAATAVIAKTGVRGGQSLAATTASDIRSEAPRRCYTNPMSTDELLAEALRLTRVDRARVAEELLSSLEEPDDEVAAAWATELERRSARSLKAAFSRPAGRRHEPRS